MLELGVGADLVRGIGRIFWGLIAIGLWLAISKPKRGVKSHVRGAGAGCALGLRFIATTSIDSAMPWPSAATKLRMPHADRRWLDQIPNLQTTTQLLSRDMSGLRGGNTMVRFKNGTLEKDAAQWRNGMRKRREEDSACRTQLHPRTCMALMLLATVTTLTQAEDKAAPPEWRKLVTTKGQSMPVPEAWLSDEEAQIAHSLIPPSVAPQPVPFDFEQPWHERLWFGAHRKQAVRYFNHLCSTEAGQWIVRTVPNVEGLFFSRPRPKDRTTAGYMGDLFGPENPWIEREFPSVIKGLSSEGGWFVSPPYMNYRFVEQPRREAAVWQKNIVDPYVRLFGLTRELARDQAGRLTDHLRDKTPMQVIGAPMRAARYGYTWRGIKRPWDREHGIAGGEVLIYDLHTAEVLGLRRQFLFTSGNRRNGEKAAWEVAVSCPQVRDFPQGREFSWFSLSVLETAEPSVRRK